MKDDDIRPADSKKRRPAFLIFFAQIVFLISVGALMPVFFDEPEILISKKGVIQEISDFSAALPRELPVSEDVRKKIEINLTEQRMYLWHDEAVVNKFVISSGKAATPTKPGNFSIISKYPVGYGGAQGVRWTMPYFMGIYKVKETENGIHELPFLNGFRESPRSLGRPVSHGCIRLGIGDAEIVYNWADLGTPVWIHY